MSRRRRRPHGLAHYAAPTAFLAGATIAIVLVASALHGEQPAPTPGPTTAAQPATTTRPQPQPRPATTSTSADGRRFYTVVAGDTFGVIAEKTGTSVEQLQQLNPDVSSTALRIGQRLRVA